jgi:phytoene/squalene synthetase
VNLGGWNLHPEDVHGDRHIEPADDLRPHALTMLCWCNPRRDRDEASIVSHNAMDRRETYEEGRPLS